MGDCDFLDFLKRYAYLDRKFYTGTSTPPRGYKKKMRLGFRKLYKKTRHQFGRA